MVNSNSEIGGYLELWENRGKMLHEGAIALNSGRSCLEYLIRARGIKKILLPYYLCDSLEEICKTGGGIVGFAITISIVHLLRWMRTQRRTSGCTW